MKQMEVRYKGDLRTESTHIKSRKTILTDAPVDNNGKGEAHSPTDLLCSALASCMLTIMGIEAQKNDWRIEGINVEVEKMMQANPRKVSGIRLLISMPPSSPQDEAARSVLEEAARTCPVALSLHDTLRQEMIFKYL
jgi:putative redox protein